MNEHESHPFDGEGRLQVLTISVPGIANDEVLVKTGGAFICGTDVRMFNGTKAMPLTLGHEVAGTINPPWRK